MELDRRRAGNNLQLLIHRVVDDEGNDVLPGEIDEIGEIAMKGHNVMKGYWDKPKETAKAIRDGWFHTGDMARQDSDGFYFIVDRKKEMIIRGGYNVYPREIEEVYAHPAIAEAAVVGVPHPELGEEVGAAVALKPGDQLYGVGWRPSSRLSRRAGGANLRRSDLGRFRTPDFTATVRCTLTCANIAVRCAPGAAHTASTRTGTGHDLVIFARSDIDRRRRPPPCQV